MAVRRLDNIGIVVEDMPTMIAFFKELGLTLVGEAPIEGEWSDRVVGLQNQKVDIAMMATPDGHSRLEMARYHRPAAIAGPKRMPNTLGIGRIMFCVDDLRDTVARLREKHGAELVGEIVQYEDAYLLCYLRGPEDILLGLAEELA